MNMETAESDCLHNLMSQSLCSLQREDNFPTVFVQHQDDKRCVDFLLLHCEQPNVYLQIKILEVLSYFKSYHFLIVPVVLSKLRSHISSVQIAAIDTLACIGCCDDIVINGLTAKLRDVSWNKAAVVSAALKALLTLKQNLTELVENILSYLSMEPTSCDSARSGDALCTLSNVHRVMPAPLLELYLHTLFDVELRDGAQHWFNLLQILDGKQLANTVEFLLQKLVLAGDTSLNTPSEIDVPSTSHPVNSYLTSSMINSCTARHSEVSLVLKSFECIVHKLSAVHAQQVAPLLLNLPITSVFDHVLRREVLYFKRKVPEDVFRSVLLPCLAPISAHLVRVTQAEFDQYMRKLTPKDMSAGEAETFIRLLLTGCSNVNKSNKYAADKYCLSNTIEAVLHCAATLLPAQSTMVTEILTTVFTAVNQMDATGRKQYSPLLVAFIRDQAQYQAVGILSFLCMGSPLDSLLRGDLKSGGACTLVEHCVKYAVEAGEVAALNGPYQSRTAELTVGNIQYLLQHSDSSCITSALNGLAQVTSVGTGSDVDVAKSPPAIKLAVVRVLFTALHSCTDFALKAKMRDVLMRFGGSDLGDGELLLLLGDQLDSLNQRSGTGTELHTYFISTMAALLQLLVAVHHNYSALNWLVCRVESQHSSELFDFNDMLLMSLVADTLTTDQLIRLIDISLTATDHSSALRFAEQFVVPPQHWAAICAYLLQCDAAANSLIVAVVAANIRSDDCCAVESAVLDLLLLRAQDHHSDTARCALGGLCRAAVVGHNHDAIMSAAVVGHNHDAIMSHMQTLLSIVSGALEHSDCAVVEKAVELLEVLCESRLPVADTAIRSQAIWQHIALSAGRLLTPYVVSRLVHCAAQCKVEAAAQFADVLLGYLSDSSADGVQLVTSNYCLINAPLHYMLEVFTAVLSSKETTPYATSHSILNALLSDDNPHLRTVHLNTSLITAMILHFDSLTPKQAATLIKMVETCTPVHDSVVRLILANVLSVVPRVIAAGSDDKNIDVTNNNQSSGCSGEVQLGGMVQLVIELLFSVLSINCAAGSKARYSAATTTILHKIVAKLPADGVHYAAQLTVKTFTSRSCNVELLLLAVTPIAKRTTDPPLFHRLFSAVLHSGAAFRSAAIFSEVFTACVESVQQGCIMQVVQQVLTPAMCGAEESGVREYAAFAIDKLICRAAAADRAALVTLELFSVLNDRLLQQRENTMAHVKNALTTCVRLMPSELVRSPELRELVLQNLQSTAPKIIQATLCFTAQLNPRLETTSALELVGTLFTDNRFSPLSEYFAAGSGTQYVMTDVLRNLLNLMPRELVLPIIKIMAEGPCTPPLRCAMSGLCIEALANRVPPESVDAVYNSLLGMISGGFIVHMSLVNAVAMLKSRLLVSQQGALSEQSMCEQLDSDPTAQPTTVHVRHMNALTLVCIAPHLAPSMLSTNIEGCSSFAQSLELSYQYKLDNETRNTALRCFMQSVPETATGEVFAVLLKLRKYELVSLYAERIGDGVIISVLQTLCAVLECKADLHYHSTAAAVALYIIQLCVEKELWCVYDVLGFVCVKAGVFSVAVRRPVKDWLGRETWFGALVTMLRRSQLLGKRIIVTLDL